ncbi:MAG TPA: glutamyl-tRNA reductase [Mycobacteriales bacterium]|nr:glutamyl-tRNA reductase [Mycobacteriales bacterium]
MTAVGCLSVSGCKASLELLERLAYTRDELPERLPRLRAAGRARAVAVLSTCQRVEVYAAGADPDALLTALAADRGVPREEVAAAVTRYDDAARHLLRVATGLESFALGESEIAGQVRAAAAAARAAGGDDVELHRLFATAVSASRRAHGLAGVAAASRSVAGVAVEAVLPPGGGARLLVVGAGQVAEVAVERALERGAAVTVCSRTRRHADRFAAAGATVVDLAELPRCLAGTDIAVLATAAPHPLVDVPMVRTTGPLTLVDLGLPRNVDPAVRRLPSVRLLDLADLRAAGIGAAGTLAADVAAVEEVIEAELARHRRWSAGRSMAGTLGRVRAEADAVAREEYARIAAAVPAEARPSVERALLRTAHRLAHDTTRLLLAAGSADQPDAAGRLGRAALDVRGAQLRPVEEAAHECGVHAADELAV